MANSSVFIIIPQVLGLVEKGFKIIVINHQVATITSMPNCDRQNKAAIPRYITYSPESVSVILLNKVEFAGMIFFEVLALK
jgi:hypothetical protein